MASASVVPSGGGGAEDGAATTRDRIFGFVPSSQDPGTLQGTKLLRLRVIAGHNLAKKDIFGASDPYLRIDLIDSREEVEDTVITKTKKRTLNPKWNEEFVFRVKPHEHKLVLEVFDENRLTRDDFLGMVELPLMNMAMEGPPGSETTVPHKHYLLRPRSARSKVRGHLQLYHAFLHIDTSEESSSDPSQSTPVATEGSNNGWEVVSTGTPAAASIQGDPNGAEPFVVEGEEGTTTTTNGNSSGSNRGERGQSGQADTSSAGSNRSHASRLPEGWEQREDNNGRVYYVNHVSRTTQWQHPGHADSGSRRNRSSDRSRGGGASSAASRASSTATAAASGATGGSSSSQARGEGGVAGETGGTSSAGHESGRESSGSTGHPNRFHFSQDDSAAAGQSITRSDSQLSIPTQPSFDTATGLNNLNITDSDVPDSGGGGGGGGTEEASTSGTASTTAGGGGGAGGGTSSGSTTVHDVVRDAQRANATRSSGQTGGVNSEGLPSGWSLQVAPNGRVFFINHSDKKTTWVDPRTGRPSPLPSDNRIPNRTRHEDDLGPLPEGWEERVHTDGRIFFIDHNTRQTQWEDPRISNPTVAGPAIPYNRDYKRKYEFLKSQLKRPSNVPNKHDIKVRRAHLLEDSFRSIMNERTVRNVDVLKTKLWIEFDGEMGLDYGGVAREWFYLLSREMFNPYYGLFEYSAVDNYTLQINHKSELCNENHLEYFKFIGRVAGMAVYHGKLLDGFFIRPFYKMMLGKPIELKDMESVDIEYYNSMVQTLNMDESELAALDLTFQIEDENFGAIVSRELKPGGAKEPVTIANRDEWIQLVINWKFVSRVDHQMKAFLEGFNELVQLNLLKIFDEGELELLMCGIGAIDVKDWKQHTVYKGDYHANHIVIQWFWRVVLSFNNEMRSRLLQFVTGTSRVPMNGFKELYGSNGPQPFTIEKIGNPNSFPRAHTCFNRLDLPPYESYQQLKEKVVRAIEGSEGFSGVD